MFFCLSCGPENCFPTFSDFPNWLIDWLTRNQIKYWILVFYCICYLPPFHIFWITPPKNGSGRNSELLFDCRAEGGAHRSGACAAGDLGQLAGGVSGGTKYRLKFRTKQAATLAYLYITGAEPEGRVCGSRRTVVGREGHLHGWVSRNKQLRFWNIFDVLSEKFLIKNIPNLNGILRPRNANWVEKVARHFQPNSEEGGRAGRRDRCGNYVALLAKCILSCWFQNKSFLFLQLQFIADHERSQINKAIHKWWVCFSKHKFFSDKMFFSEKIFLTYSIEQLLWNKVQDFDSI